MSDIPYKLANANIDSMLIEISYFLAALKVINWCVVSLKGRIRHKFLIKLNKFTYFQLRGKQ